MKRLLFSMMLTLFLVSTAFAKVNINTAGVDELQGISGIGPAKAEAIVKHREEHGTFKNKEELTAVKGIGDKLFRKISDEVVVSD
jgi:competence protein ComEA